jgi:quercetin dioxygenase-like cupin family protein
MRRARIAWLACLAACGGASSTPRQPAATPPPGSGQGSDEASAAAAAAVERAVNQLSPAIHTCWAIGAADDFRLEGEVVLSLVIGAGGAAERVEVVRDTAGDPILVDCLKELWAAQRWPAEVFAAGDAVRLPPFRFGAPDGQYSVSSAHVPRRPLGPGGPAAASTAQVVLQPDNTGNGAAALSLLELAPGLVVPRHRHGSAELLLVLSGAGRMRERRVSAGDAVYVPAGAPHELENPGPAPLVAVQLYAPAGPERRFLGGTDPGTQPVPPGEGGRAPAPRVVSAARARAHAILGGKGRARIAFDAASARDDAASLVALTLEPGAELPAHVHDGASEYVYVIEGKGVLRVDDQDLPIAAGDAFQIPSGIEHGFRADPGGQVKAVQFYTPAGPEQRFPGGAR